MTRTDEQVWTNRLIDQFPLPWARILKPKQEQVANRTCTVNCKISQTKQNKIVEQAEHSQLNEPSLLATMIDDNHQVFKCFEHALAGGGGCH